MPTKLSKYELVALKEIHRWKNPLPTKFSRVTTYLGKPFNAAGQAFYKIPGFAWVLQKAIGGLVSLLNDGAQWSVRPESINNEFKLRGYNVNSSEDLLLLDLADIDKVIGALGAKYKLASSAEGAGAGFGGLLGIPVDITATIFLSLRAIGEYAIYCGFNPRLQSEQLFAMGLLSYCSSTDQAAKNTAMAQMVKIAKDVAMKKPWRDLQKSVIVQIIKQVAEALGVRLTKQKLAQILPIASAAIGAGFNAYYMNKICDSAYYLYRERFLAAKYGPDIIESTTKEADGYDPVPDSALENIGVAEQSVTPQVE